MKKLWITISRPLPAVMITAIVCVFIISAFLFLSKGDPLVFVRIGTRFSENITGGSEGYDGQFGYYIALDPNPLTVAGHLDNPAYRYQRILLPLLARILAFGNPQAIPWMILVINLLAHLAGVGLLASILEAWKINPLFSLIYGLYAGLLLSIRLDLSEPLAMMLVLLGVWAILHDRPVLIVLGFLGAAFAKELSLIFFGAFLLGSLREYKFEKTYLYALLVGIPYSFFQIWLFVQFGQFGIGSGGAMATRFEWIPFMGLFRIGATSFQYLAAMLIVFTPLVIVPSMWGIVRLIQDARLHRLDIFSFFLGLNALVMLFIPFSTYRETGGILRISIGLVLATILYCAQRGYLKALRYSSFWLVYNVFFFK